MTPVYREAMIFRVVKVLAWMIVVIADARMRSSLEWQPKCFDYTKTVTSYDPQGQMKSAYRLQTLRASTFIRLRSLKCAVNNISVLLLHSTVHPNVTQRHLHQNLKVTVRRPDTLPVRTPALSPSSRETPMRPKPSFRSARALDLANLASWSSRRCHDSI